MELRLIKEMGYDVLTLLLGLLTLLAVKKLRRKASPTQPLHLRAPVQLRTLGPQHPYRH
jgi:hypothetical protein